MTYTHLYIQTTRNQPPENKTPLHQQERPSPTPISCINSLSFLRSVPSFVFPFLFPLYKSLLSHNSPLPTMFANPGQVPPNTTLPLAKMGPLHILDLGSPDNLLNANLTHYPPTPPSQVTANLAARVVLGLAANAAMAVPLRILYRHGEFAAAVFITTTMILNGFTIVHALVWRDDDTSAWWLGEGYCDAFPYVYFPLMMVYDTSIFAIMRHLAQQISLVRADAPTPRELRRRSIVQALVIFPLPLVQLAWMYPLTEHRYGLMTLSGCRWLPVDAWPLTVFFILMYPLYALGALYYASKFKS